MLNLVIGLSLTLSGVIIVLLCKPLAMRKVKPNHWYGFRFRESFQSEENWYRINAYGASRMINWSLLMAIIGLLPIAYALAEPNGSLICWCLPWMWLVLLIPVLQTTLFVRSLRSDQPAG